MFEVLERDLAARIGRVETKSGVFETPVFVPVVNPVVQPIPPREMYEEFGCRILMTNAYIIKKHFGYEAVEKGVHRLLDFPGVVATDSGAFQILQYGEVDVSAEEIALFQEDIGSDVAVILDYPTGWGAPRSRALWTVEETYRRAERTLKILRRDDILWVGPVQGGDHLDLVEYSAKLMSKLPFPVHALGSPVQVMEQYRFDVLVDMVATAKSALPPDRPLHLFGAGHPFMFSLAVALGCDMFDSASYAIYARDMRYMTSHGTMRVEDLEYLPCRCPVCSRLDADELREMPREEAVGLVARHNMYVCMAEVDRIRQAISEGRLWELLEARCRSHPSLTTALRRLGRYAELLERFSPSRKGRGFLYFGFEGLARPEVVRHRRRVLERFTPPGGRDALLMLPQVDERPFHRSREFREAWNVVVKPLRSIGVDVHVCFYAYPFAVVPVELDETYPLSQFEAPHPPDWETVRYVAETASEYVLRHRYRAVAVYGYEDWHSAVAEAVEEACRGVGVGFVCLLDERPWSIEGLSRLKSLIEDRVNTSVNKHETTGS